MTETSPLILIVEDEPKLAELIADYLQHAGFRTAIRDRADQAIPAVHELTPDLLILDLMLPGGDGFDITRELRRFSGLPLIMVTARVEEVDRVLGLELGADDYLCKPFSPRELVARVRARLRRRSPFPQPDARLWVDREARRARVHGSELDLTPTEFELLALLASHPGRVFARDELLDRIYADYRVVSSRTVDSHVKNLRRKLAAAAPGDEFIQAVYGTGYRFLSTPSGAAH